MFVISLVGFLSMFSAISAGELLSTERIPAGADARVIALENGYDQRSDEKTVQYSKKVEYFKNGKKIGERRWYLNGRLSEERIYENGVLNGLSRIWNDDGSLNCESEYKNGKREGKTTFYHPNGTIYQIFPFRNGKVHGIARSCDKDRVSQSIGEYYFDGNRVGKYNINGRSVSKDEYLKALSIDQSLTPTQDD